MAISRAQDPYSLSERIIPPLEVLLKLDMNSDQSMCVCVCVCVCACVCVYDVCVYASVCVCVCMVIEDCTGSGCGFGIVCQPLPSHMDGYMGG